MSRRRSNGQASVEEHPKGSGRWRVRAKVGGTLRTVASQLSEAEAIEVANGYAYVRSVKELADGLTLRAFGVTFLDVRQERGLRSVDRDRNRWKCYVASDEIGALPVRSLRRKDVLLWRDRLLRRVSAQTATNALNLLRSALQEALDREIVETNVAREVRVPRYAKATDREELGGVLLPEEQQAITTWLAKHHQEYPDALPAVVLALMTGTRQGELWSLRWGCVREDEVVIRTGSSGPTKAGRSRRMPLLGPARETLAALRARATSTGPDDLVFPGRRRGRGQDGALVRKPHAVGFVPNGWKQALKACGITRRVRWHDLRHTCATSLLAGWWGRRWDVREVQLAMGHASVTTTERYVRFIQETLVTAVSETAGPRFPRLESSQKVPRARRLK